MWADGLLPLQRIQGMLEVFLELNQPKRLLRIQRSCQNEFLAQHVLCAVLLFVCVITVPAFGQTNNII